MGEGESCLAPIDYVIYGQPRMAYHTETAEVTEGHLEEKEVQCLFNLLPSWAPRAPRPLPVISFFAQKPLEGT